MATFDDEDPGMDSWEFLKSLGSLANTPETLLSMLPGTRNFFQPRSQPLTEAAREMIPGEIRNLPGDIMAAFSGAPFPKPIKSRDEWERESPVRARQERDAVIASNGLGAPVPSAGEAKAVNALQKKLDLILNDMGRGPEVSKAGVGWSTKPGFSSNKAADSDVFVMEGDQGLRGMGLPFLTGGGSFSKDEPKPKRSYGGGVEEAIASVSLPDEIKGALIREARKNPEKATQMLATAVEMAGQTSRNDAMKAELEAAKQQVAVAQAERLLKTPFTDPSGDDFLRRLQALQTRETARTGGGLRIKQPQPNPSYKKSMIPDWLRVGEGDPFTNNEDVENTLRWFQTQGVVPDRTQAKKLLSQITGIKID